MADVNINNHGNEDQIGDLFVEGFNNPKITSSLKHGPKNLVGQVYPGETLNFATIVKMNPSMDLSLWKKCISRVSGEANVHNLKTSSHKADKHATEKGIDNTIAKRTHSDRKETLREDSAQDGDENKLMCPVLVTYSGTSSKSNQCVADLDNLDLDISGFKESSCKPHFRDDTTYVIPMSLALEDVTAACHYIELHVVLWLYTVSVQTNGSSPEPDLNGQTTKDPADEMSVPATQPRKTRVPVTHSEFFDVASDEETTETKNQMPATQEVVTTSKKRVPVAHSEFFDVGSDEEETDKRTEKPSSESNTKNETAIAPVLFESSKQKNNIKSDASPVKVSSSSCSVQEKTIRKLKLGAFVHHKITRMLLKNQVPGVNYDRVMPSCKNPPSSGSSRSPRAALDGRTEAVGHFNSNKAEKQMVIKSIHMLSIPLQLHDQNIVYESGEGMKWESCHHLIKLECPRKGHVFPVILAPCERLDLIYKLQLSSMPADSEMSLRASVKWTHAGATNEITTVYRLPRIRIRSPPFIVGIKCEDEVELGKTFYVTYTIYNQLHDFMRMRLYYNLDNMWKSILEKGGTEKEKTRLDNLRNAIVCQDPDIAISSCPRGSCVRVQVGFQIHRPGLYEMSELMKVNLLYSFPETPHREHHTPPHSKSHPQNPSQQQQQQQQPRQHNQLHATSSSSSSVSATSDYGASASSSSSSPSLQSTDDTERSNLLASEELWRGRSGSTNSLATPPPANQLSAEERRRSFASKSYSFGDLGPNASADSDQGERHKPIKRSSMVAPSRPAPPRQLSKTERDLVRPSNFLKQPFYVHVRDPLSV